jgi:hypothetical protein
MIAEITTGDHSKRAHSRQRPRLGAAQGVLAVAVPDKLTLQPSREVDGAAEHIAWVDVALPGITLEPPSVNVAIAGVLVRLRTSRVLAGTATERPDVVVAVARHVGRPIPFVIAIGTAAAVRGCEPVLIARVVIARVEVHNPPLLESDVVTASPRPRVYPAQRLR